MIETTALQLDNKERFAIVWDTGKFCNYDCTYCESTRHNNFGKHKTFEEFKQTFDFIKNWYLLYDTRRKTPSKPTINFTGGEPTANPNFWALLDYIKSQDVEFELTLTTNGAWGKEFSKKVIDTFSGVTISYHTEAPKHLKDRSVQNILSLKESSIYSQVNLMLHVDYWDECMELYTMLKSKNVIVNPRPIGDGNILRKGWFIDRDGTNRRTSHEYSEEQQQWFFKEMGVTKKPGCEANGAELGRKCCANLPMTGKVDGEWQPIKLVNTNFENWYCTVDWYFLYIDQDMGEVYHHQTCKALYNKTRGPLGNLSDSEKLLSELKERLSKDIPDPIVCPNFRCGCGMCAPKAKDWDDFVMIQKELINEKPNV